MPDLTPPLIDVFDVPLINLGKVDPQFDGVYMPQPEVGLEKVGITEQFLGNAESYNALYANSTHFMRLFEEGFAAAGLVPPAEVDILDIGTGSGVNTIPPCLALFPGCRIIATDLSPNLLAMLQRYLNGERLNDRVACVCTDSMNNFFRPACFDVVVGAAILHHLLDPRRALAMAYRALRPGGVAIFFEPFEGLAIIRVAFDLILDASAVSVPPLDPSVGHLLRAISLDLATRAGSDKTAVHFQYMDDKWLFSKDWITKAAQDSGFSDLVIVAHAHHEELFQDYVQQLLKFGAGFGTDALPAWAWSIIKVFDRGFSNDIKRELLLEGTIVLRKGQ